MMHRKLITVIGASGNQGRSIIDSLLGDGTFKVRAISRKPLKEKESRSHIEWVTADIEKDSVDKLAEVLKGSYGVFLVTPMDLDETAAGMKMVDASQKAGVKHLIWSTMPDPDKISGGKWIVPFFTSKARVEEYIRKLQAKEKPFHYVTFVNPTCYYENYFGGFKPQLEGDVLVFSMPDLKHTCFSVGDMGTAVLNAFKHPHKNNMKRLHYVGQELSLSEIPKIWSKVTGQKTRFNALTLEEFAKNAPGYAQMFGYMDEYHFFGPVEGENVDGLCTFETWLMNNREEAEKIARPSIKPVPMATEKAGKAEKAAEKTKGKQTTMPKASQKVEKAGR